MKRTLLIVISILLCFTLLGCGNGDVDKKDNTTTKAESTELELSKDDGTTEHDTNEVDTSDEPETSDLESSEPELTEPVIDPADDPSVSLNNLRQAMVGTPELFAASYIGLTETMDGVDPIPWMKSKVPMLCENLPFMTAINEENIVGGDFGELYCIVPADPEATVAINIIDFDGNKGEVLYRSESGEPLLLFCNKGGFAPDTEVFITDSQGNSIVWYPQLDDEGYLNDAYDLDGNIAMMDFTSYDERLKSEYDYYLNEAGFWKVPETVDLADTSWEATDYMMDGTERTYYLDIFSDTVKIVWNDGIDEEYHTYTASWKLKTVEGITMMEVDLGNLDGVRNFCVLITTEHNLIYFAQDFVNDDIRNYEKLTRILERTYG